MVVLSTKAPKHQALQREAGGIGPPANRRHNSKADDPRQARYRVNRSGSCRPRLVPPASVLTLPLRQVPQQLACLLSPAPAGSARSWPTG